MEKRRSQRVLEEIINLYYSPEKKLKEVYCKDEETFKRFVIDQARLFSKKSLYPLIVFPKYDEIKAVIEEGNKKYSSNFIFCATAEEQLKIKDEMDIERWKERTDHNQFTDDRMQAEWIFKNTIGLSNEENSHTRFHRLMLDILAVAKESENQKNLNYNFVVDYVHKAVKFIKNPYRLEDTIKNFAEEHPLLYNCNDKYYLYYVNYMLSYYPDEIDAAFIDNVRSIINLSPILCKFGINKIGVSNEYTKEYKKLAAFTEKKIEKYEKMVDSVNKETIQKVKEIKKISRNKN